MFDLLSLVIGAVLALALQFVVKKFLFGGGSTTPPVENGTVKRPPSGKTERPKGRGSKKERGGDKDRPSSSRRSKSSKIRERSEKNPEKRIPASSQLGKHSKKPSTGSSKPTTVGGRLEARPRASSNSAEDEGEHFFSIKGLNNAGEMSRLEKAFVRGVQTNMKHGVASFTGGEVVDWLAEHVSFGESATREDATALAVRLWAKGTIRSTESSWIPFKDSTTQTYCFKNEGKTRKKMHKDTNKRKYYEQLVATSLNLKAEPKSGWLEVKEVMLHPKSKFRDIWVPRWCVLHEAKEKWTYDDKTESEEHSDLAEAARALLEDTAEPAKVEEGWELVLFDSIWDEEDSKLVQEMVDPKTGIKFLKREKMKMKSRSKRHFKGNSAVSWCVKRGKCSDEDEAIGLMNALMEKNIVIPSKRKEMPFFENSATRYRFADMIFHGGATMSHPLVRMPLGKCAMNLERDSDYIHFSLARSDGKTFLQDISGFAVEHRVDTSAGLVFRVHKKDEKVMRDWIVALNSALLVANGGDIPYGSSVALDEDESQDDFCSTLRSHVDKHRSSAIADADAEDEDKESAAEFVDEVYEGEMAKVQEMRRVLAARKEEALGAGEAYGECPTFEVNVDWAELPDAVLLKCLRSRRLDIDRAIRLMEVAVPFRKQKGHATTTIADCRSQIPELGRLIPECRDKEGRPIIVLEAKHYLPKKMTADDCIRACLYMFDVATEHLPDKDMVQRIGVSVIADCSKVSYKNNFMASQVKPLVSGILGRYPVRIGHIIVMRTPWWFTTVWKVVKPMLPADIISKVLITSKDDELFEHVTPDNCPEEFGGSYTFDAESWLKERYSVEGLTYEG